MATVQYQIQYKYINPITKNVITNTTTSKYDDLKFLRSYSSSGSVAQAEDVIEQSSISNDKFDMLFIYNGVETLSAKVSFGGSNTVKSNTVIGEKFLRCNGQPWFVASRVSSFQDALNIAKRLIKSIGKDNVQIVKVVPLDMKVEIE